MDHSKQETVGIIGLGIMGSALADQLISKGFSVFGIDPSNKARNRAKQAGVEVVPSIDVLLRHSHKLLSSLPSNEAFESICDALLQARAEANQTSNVILAETSTLPIDIKQKQERRLARAGIQLLD